jgi:hypothetical protein
LTREHSRDLGLSFAKTGAVIAGHYRRPVRAESASTRSEDWPSVFSIIVELVASETKLIGWFKKAFPVRTNNLL